MPELPEVETIRRQLARVLLGKVFSDIEVRLKKQVKGISVENFKMKVKGAKIVELDRRAKMLIIKTRKREDNYLVFHLKMSGQLIYLDKAGHLKGGGHPIKGALEKLPNKYSHVYFTFKDGSKLFFNDTRQFGWVTLVENYEAIESLSATPLGPEPLSRDFRHNKFIDCLKKRSGIRIYQAIMDQKCVVGVGNIYTNEILFYSGIRPTRRIKNIKTKEFKQLYQQILKVLQTAVKQRGTTIDKYMDVLGNFGNFSKHLKVYGQTGKKCQRRGCQGVIKRVKINTRSAFYCDKCQK